MRINEIFYSLQGEGFWTGTPMVFVRFAGCNLKCPFCDTRHEAYAEMTEEEIVEEVARHGAGRVCITGGEPCLQVTESLVEMLHAKGLKVHMETNGTLLPPANVDWVTVSPKGDCVTERCNELKLLYPGDPERYEGIVAEHRFLQPIAEEDAAVWQANIEATIDYIKGHPSWRLSLQTHKYLNIR